MSESMLDSLAGPVNALTERWASRCAGESAVFSGAGAWPLLALLADVADGPARAELSAAVGVPADEALAAATFLLQALPDYPGLDAALGLWTKASLPLRPEWLQRLPANTHEMLDDDPGTAQRRLDTWAAERTHGQIPTMPVTARRDTDLVLASALTAETSWVSAFDDTEWTISAGPWAGRTVAGLSQESLPLEAVRLSETPWGLLTSVDIAGDGSFDVRLVLGEQGRSASDVLTAAVRAQTGACRWTSGSALPLGAAGPGLTVRQAPSPVDRLRTLVPRFRVAGRTDLVASPEVFGLSHATIDTPPPFLGISPEVLIVSQAAQNAVATFTARGFRAAAVTAMDVACAGAPYLRATAREIAVTVDRPFGFLVVDRSCGVILFAGWVAEPETWTPPSRDAGVVWP